MEGYALKLDIQRTSGQGMQNISGKGIASGKAQVMKELGMFYEQKEVLGG